MSTSIRRLVVLVLVLPVLTLAACTLPGGAPHGPAYQISADFSDVLDLVPQAAVKVNDVTVGSVQKITLSGWNARVEMAIDRDVRLPANATAAIGQTSLLGEKYVALAAPTGEPGQGTLADGAVIPLSRTSRSAEVEEVLGALGLLLNGGGLAQLKTISEELTKALAGRESTVTDLLRQLDTFLAGLDAQKADILRAIDALDNLSAHLAQQRTTIGNALDALGPGLTVLADQRQQLTAALTSLSRLSSVGTHVIEASRQATADSLKSLQPILDQLVRAGDSLPKALDFLLTYPFPPNVTGAISGNSVRLHATLDLNGAEILANLLTQPNPPGAASGGSGGGLLPPITPPQLPIPVPTLPPLPLPPVPTLPPLPLPTPSLSPTGILPTGVCSPLGLPIGCGK
jgi:phospholipid/cholesterol/gamma-HCH transport system substrate-binding protein